jgi:hypothetical protein
MSTRLRRHVAGIAAICSCAALGCNTLAGIGDPQDRAPGDLVAWEPRPTAAGAHVTFVSATAQHTYVGFANGEIHFRGSGGASGWEPMNGGMGNCQAPMPAIAVSAMVVTSRTIFGGEEGGTLFVGMAGSLPQATPPKKWFSLAVRGCWGLFAESYRDVWGLSSSFSELELVAVSPGLTEIGHSFGSRWEPSAPGALPIGFDGTVSAFANGVTPLDGGRRVWMGDADGKIYFADDVDAAGATAPEATTWTPVAEPRFPGRAVVAIATAAPDRLERIWITFAGLYDDSLWYSPDNGTSWRNVYGGALRAHAGSLGAATFTAVSPVPGLDYAYVTALTPGPQGTTNATSYWSAVGSSDWSQR